MVEKARILLIDDNEHSRHDLETVLSFLGEETVSVNSSNWHSRTSEVTGQTTQIDVAIIGVCEFVPLGLLLSEIYQWEPGIPFVLVGDHELQESLDPELLSRVTAVLEAKLSYQLLLDALHKAKIFHEHYNRVRDFDGAPHRHTWIFVDWIFALLTGFIVGEVDLGLDVPGVGLLLAVGHRVDKCRLPWRRARSHRALKD